MCQQHLGGNFILCFRFFVFLSLSSFAPFFHRWISNRRWQAKCFGVFQTNYFAFYRTNKHPTEREGNRIALLWKRNDAVSSCTHLYSALHLILFFVLQQFCNSEVIREVLQNDDINFSIYFYMWVIKYEEWNWKWQVVRVVYDFVKNLSGDLALIRVIKLMAELGQAFCCCCWTLSGLDQTNFRWLRGAEDETKRPARHRYYIIQNVFSAERAKCKLQNDCRECRETFDISRSDVLKHSRTNICMEM